MAATSTAKKSAAKSTTVKAEAPAVKRPATKAAPKSTTKAAPVKAEAKKPAAKKAPVKVTPIKTETKKSAAPRTPKIVAVPAQEFLVGIGNEYVVAIGKDWIDLNKKAAVAMRFETNEAAQKWIKRNKIFQIDGIPTKITLVEAGKVSRKKTEQYAA